MKAIAKNALKNPISLDFPAVLCYNRYSTKRLEECSVNVRSSSKDNQSLAQENAALRNEVNMLKEQLALLQEQFDWLKKQVFGRKTEQNSVIMDGGTRSKYSFEGVLSLNDLVSDNFMKNNAKGNI